VVTEKGLRGFFRGSPPFNVLLCEVSLKVPEIVGVGMPDSDPSEFSLKVQTISPRTLVPSARATVLVGFDSASFLLSPSCRPKN
jgi:hypothetical protein